MQRPDARAGAGADRPPRGGRGRRPRPAPASGRGAPSTCAASPRPRWRRRSDARRARGARDRDRRGVRDGARRRAGREDIETVYETLASSRPTAVNLRWALDAMRDDPTPERAARIHADDAERCRRMGAHAVGALLSGARVLTHCNAGGSLRRLRHGARRRPRRLRRRARRTSGSARRGRSSRARA